MGALPPLLLAAAMLLLSLPQPAPATFSMPSPWVWRCQSWGDKDDRCVREPLSLNSTGATSFATCQLICGKYGTLWPYPKTAQLGKTVSFFLPTSVSQSIIANEQDTPLLNAAVDIFMNNLNRFHPDYKDGVSVWQNLVNPSKHELKLMIEIVGPSKSRVSLDTSDEAYDLNVDTLASVTIARIKSKTFFGARHALETLLQLMDYEEAEDSLQIVNFAAITDKPSFPYRGILLDTSRNFITVESIERTLNAMAASKLNTFHWHITDTHTFPMVIKSLPNMAFYGAYSSRQLYQPEDIRHVVEYGRVRGIRVLPEFDAPSHVGAGWEWGPKEKLGELAVCVNREPWYEYCLQPPCGQLNIANDNIYTVLGKIYEEMVQLFGPLDMFHYGGDEVNITCWNTTQEISDWMQVRGVGLSADSYYQEWGNFQTKAQQLVTQANKGVEIPGILWTSHLTDKVNAEKYIDQSKYIIQIWSKGDDPVIKDLLERGYRVIFSNSDAWYLDCGFGAYVGAGNNWCSPYKGWQKVYDNSPRRIALDMTGNATHLNLILGGEVALWTEQVDNESVDGRIWPRAAALAERLWSDPESGWEDAEYRMVHHRQRLVRRGVQAERLQPEWCHQNEGMCYARYTKLPGFPGTQETTPSL